MPYAAVLIVIVGFFGLTARPPTSDDIRDSVVGLWLGEDRTRGGLGSWIELRADGTAELGFGALIGGRLDETYQLEGTTLRLRAFSGRTTPAGEPVFESLQKEVRIEGDRAIVESQVPKDAPDPKTLPPDERAMLDRMRQPLIMKRVGHAGAHAPAIVGTWSYQHYTGTTAYETFTPQGKWYLRVPMQVVRGTYTLSRDAITIRRSGKTETFTRDGGLLTSVVGGKRSTFRRAPS